MYLVLHFILDSPKLKDILYLQSGIPYLGSSADCSDCHPALASGHTFASVAFFYFAPLLPKTVT